MTKIKIRNLEVKEGSKIFGFIDVDQTSTTIYRIPLAIFNGSNPGPILCVLGGIHGLEYSSIEAVLRVIEELDPEKLSGVLLGVPVANQASFEARTAFISPLDGLNQNRCFPGDPKGTMSYRVAHTLFSEVVSKANYLIDCHGGDLNEDVYNLVAVGVSNKEETNKAMMEMARCFNTKYVEKSTITDSGEAAIFGTTRIATKIYGIPSITTESGIGGQVRESSVEFTYDGIKNVMKYLGMIKGKAVRYEYTVNPEVYKFTAEKGGIFRLKVKLGDMVPAGDVAAEVVDLFGRQIQTVRAPADSQVAITRVFYAVNPGEPLVWLYRTHKK